MSLRAKVECFSAENNGIVEAVHRPEFLEPGADIVCDVVQKSSPIWVSLSVKGKRSSSTRSCVPTGELDRKVV